MSVYPRVGVSVLVIKEGQILLGERINAHGSGSWCPPGGHLEFGESPIECAKRELKEETGLTAHHVIEGSWTNDYFEREGKHYITVHMIVKEFEGVAEVQEPEKCLSWQWFDWEELPSPLFLSLVNLTKKHSLSEYFSDCLSVCS